MKKTLNIKKALHALEIPLLCATLFIFGACSSDDESSDVAPAEKYLRQITINEHPVKFGEVSGIGELYEQYRFNEKGELIHKTSCHRTPVQGFDRYQNDEEYVYDAEGHLIQKDELSFYTLQYRYKYTYNDIDSVSTESQYDDEGRLCYTRNFQYNADRKLIKELYKIESSANVSYEKSYAYEGNTVTCTSVRLKDGSLYSISVYEYDSHGNLLKETWTNGDTGKTSVEVLNTFDYDSKGRIAKSTHAGAVFLDHKEIKEYQYNEDNTIKKILLSYSYKDYKSELIYGYEYR